MAPSQPTTLLEHFAKLQTVLNKKHTIALFAHCSVGYSGRAQSFLERGDRVIIVKGDGSVLVHQATGNTPVNYMKQGTQIHLRAEGEEIIMKCENVKGKEHMTITLHAIHSFTGRKLEDSETITLAGSESDMAQHIMQYPSLIGTGFKPLVREQQTKYGFVDVYGVDSEGNSVVVECKRYTADLSAVTQLRRYVERMRELKGNNTIKGVLAAPKITDNAMQMLLDWGFEFRKVEPPHYLEKEKQRQKKLF